MAAVSSAKHNNKANTSEMKMDQSSVLEHPQDVLETCATGQWSALQTVLSAAGIVAPAPAITVHNKSKYALPQTHEMVEAAIRGKQCSIIELIYKIFPSARLHGPELIAAAEVGDVEMFKLLHKQSHSKYDVVHRVFEDRESMLVKACRGKQPHIALYLLEHGADPNYCGAGGDYGALFGPLGNAIVDNHPLLVEKLIDAGAEVEHVHVLLAVEEKRVEVVRVLINRGSEKINLKRALSRAKKVDCDEVVKVLVRRIKDGPESDEGSSEEEGERHARWHHIRDHFLGT